MNDTLIVTTFVLLDDLMQGHGHRTDVRAVTSDSEVLTVAVIAAAQFANHHERALCVLRGMHYLSGPLSLSRFNRRLHALVHWFTLALDLLCAVFAHDTATFTLDSLPVPVCTRVRDHRASTGTQKMFSERYSSRSSGSAPSSMRFESAACFSSKASEMYFKKMRPSTTPLYSLASRLPRSVSAVAHSVASKPMVAPVPAFVAALPFPTAIDAHFHACAF